MKKSQWQRQILAMAHGKNLRLTVTAAVKDSTGLALANNFTWQFATAPRVNITVNTNSVPANTPMDTNFIEAFNPLRHTKFNFSMRRTASGATVAGTTSYSGENALFIQVSAQISGTISGNNY